MLCWVCLWVVWFGVEIDDGVWYFDGVRVLVSGNLFVGCVENCVNC